MLTKFSIFNLDSFYSQVDFQTTATPISDGIIHFHHDLMFLLTFIVFFVLWMIFRTFQLHAYPNERSLVLTRGIIKPLPMGTRIHSRNFSTMPSTKNTNPNSLFTKFIAFFKNLKKKYDSLMFSFVKNEYKQHEIFLFFYSLSIILCNLSLFGVKAVCLAFVFMIFFLIIYYLLIKMNKFLNSSQLYSVVSISIFVLILAFFEYYRIIFVFVLFCTTAFLKELYLEKYKMEKRTTFYSFLNDFQIVDYHFSKEFYLFDHIRKYNLLLLCSVVYSFSSIVSDSLLIPITMFWDIELFFVAQEVIFIVFIFNNFLTAVIAFIIIDYCNPHVELSLLQKCAYCVVIGGGCTLTYFGFHVINTTPLFTPMDSELGYSYQKTYWGCSAKSSADIILINQYMLLTSDPVPVKEDGFADSDKMRAFIYNSAKAGVHETVQVSKNSILWGTPPASEIKQKLLKK